MGTSSRACAERVTADKGAPGSVALLLLSWALPGLWLGWQAFWTGKV